VAGAPWRSRSERRGDLVLARPQRRGTQQTVVGARLDDRARRSSSHRIGRRATAPAQNQQRVEGSRVAALLGSSHHIGALDPAGHGVLPDRTSDAARARVLRSSYRFRRRSGLGADDRLGGVSIAPIAGARPALCHERHRRLAGWRALPCRRRRPVATSWCGRTNAIVPFRASQSLWQRQWLLVRQKGSPLRRRDARPIRRRCSTPLCEVDGVTRRRCWLPRR
jgi:hypothetical protein